MDHMQRLAAIDARIKQRLADLDTYAPEPERSGSALIAYALTLAPVFAVLFAALSNLGA